MDNRYTVIRHPDRLELYGHSLGQVSHIATHTLEDDLCDDMRARSVDTLSIIDRTDNQSIKIDQGPVSLSLIDFALWFWKKRALEQQRVAAGFVRPYVRSKAMLSVGLYQLDMQKRIGQALPKICMDSFSYDAELAYTLHAFMRLHHEGLKKCLLVTLHRDGSLGTFCFHDQRLVFYRSWPQQQAYCTDRYTKTSVMDTIRYLEKLHIDKGDLVFFTEGQDRQVQEAFKDSLVLSVGDVVGHKKEASFDQLLMMSKRHFRPLCKTRASNYQVIQAGKWGAQTSISMALLCLAYDNVQLWQHNQQIFERVHRLQDQAAVVKASLEKMPLSYSQACEVKKVIKISYAQQEKLWRFVETLPDIFGDDIRLQTFLLGPEKACFSLESETHPSSIREVISSWNQSLPAYQASVIEGASSVRSVGHHDHPQALMIECASPLCHDRP